MPDDINRNVLLAILELGSQGDDDDNEDTQAAIDHLVELSGDPARLAELESELGEKVSDSDNDDNDEARLSLTTAEPDRAKKEHAAPVVDAVIDRGIQAGLSIAGDIRARVLADLKKKGLLDD